MMTTIQKNFEKMFAKFAEQFDHRNSLRKQQRESNKGSRTG